MQLKIQGPPLIKSKNREILDTGIKKIEGFQYF